VGRYSPENRVALKGEWGLDRKDELKAVFDSLWERQPATIDMRGLTYFDSTGLGLLAQVVVRFGKTPVRLVGPNPFIRRVLHIMRFDELFEIDEGDEAKL
jgi:anti-anti-sigma factor